LPIVLFLLSFSSLAFSQCTFTDTVPDAIFNYLISQIKSKPFTVDKILVVHDYTSNLTLGFNSTQTAVMLSLFSFVSDRLQVLTLINNYILTLDCSGVAEILNAVPFSSDKLNALSNVVNLTNRADLEVNFAQIIQCFAFATDQATARQIIVTSSQRSCLFGPANLPRFAFVIDVSGSMSEQFRDIDGMLYTRLSYVQRDLTNVLNGTLKSFQQFNIISFSDNANAWQPGVVQANNANIASATTFVARLTPGGGTYMLQALKSAFSDPQVQGLYFLSDGIPSDSTDSILNFISSFNPLKPVNTIAFKTDSSAQNFLLQMAVRSKGTFRAIV